MIRLGTRVAGQSSAKAPWGGGTGYLQKIYRNSNKRALSIIFENRSVVQLEMCVFHGKTPPPI